jgi:hypothetical protein
VSSASQQPCRRGSYMRGVGARVEFRVCHNL